MQTNSGMVQIEIQDGVQLVSPYAPNLKSESVENENYPDDEEAVTKHWDRDGTLALIAAYSRHIDDFNNPSVRQYTVWKKIEAELRELQIEVTTFHCVNKWKCLLRVYRRLKLSQPQKPARSRFAYFKEMDELLKGRNIADMHESRLKLGGGITLKQNGSTMKECASKDNDDGSSSDEDNPSLVISSRKRKEDDFFSFLKDYFVEKRKRMLVEAKMKEERHKKKMELEQCKIELLKALLQK